MIILSAITSCDSNGNEQKYKDLTGVWYYQSNISNGTLELDYKNNYYILKAGSTIVYKNVLYTLVNDFTFNYSGKTLYDITFTTVVNGIGCGGVEITLGTIIKKSNSLLISNTQSYNVVATNCSSNSSSENEIIKLIRQ